VETAVKEWFRYVILPYGNRRQKKLISQYEKCLVYAGIMYENEYDVILRIYIGEFVSHFKIQVPMIR
jgi:hypothetical protein